MLAVAVVTLALPAAGFANGPATSAYVPAALLAAAEGRPDATFRVVIEGRKGVRSDDVAESVRAEAGATKRKFASVDGVLAEVTGKQLVRLARHPRVFAITPDAATLAAEYEQAEMWRSSTATDAALKTPVLSLATPATMPAIAIVDSGVDATKLEFAGRLVAQVNLCSVCAGAIGDDYGHGTMVAGLAASGSSSRYGAAPKARIVSLRTADAQGRSLVSDVIAAADWILANKAAYNIRVANFSLTRADVTSLRFDPLNHAVEKLWLNGVVVVAAAGNHGQGTVPVTIKAPASDPFVISVGAVDQNKSGQTADDEMALWSAHGTSRDGFTKPEVSAPGRWLIAPVPLTSTLRYRFPERIVNAVNGTMWMSGTSMSAALVSGAAANMLANNPRLTPDQVKGALMLTARPIAGAGTKGGVGEIDALAALNAVAPPNPNANLYAFVTRDAAGQPVFDAEAWASTAATQPTWSTAAWSEAAWSEAAWSEAAWAEAAWSEAAWSEAAWSEAAWSEAAWAEAAWAEAAWHE